MVQLYFVVLALTFFVSAPALAARTHKGAAASIHKGKVVEASLVGAMRALFLEQVMDSDVRDHLHERLRRPIALPAPPAP